MQLPRKVLTAGVLFAVFGFSSAAAQTPAKRYHLEGKVVSVRPAAKQLVIDHKAIPGFMSAMTMPYTVRDSAAIAKVKPGDPVSADVVVSGGSTWLENVKTGASPAKNQPRSDSTGVRNPRPTPMDSSRIAPKMDPVKMDAPLMDSARIDSTAVNGRPPMDTSKMVMPRDSMRPPKDTIGLKPATDSVTRPKAIRDSVKTPREEN